MMPHVDLSKSDRVGQWRQMVTSTHTFLLYLRDCSEGGETVLLDTLRNQGGGIIEAATGGGKMRVKGDSAVGSGVKRRRIEDEGPVASHENKHLLASVAPRRGRLLLFPHVCPHAGLEVVDAPKLFLRGELR